MPSLPIVIVALLLMYGLANAKGSNMTNAQIAADVARAGGIPVKVAMGIMAQESSGNPKAFNAEGSQATPDNVNGGNPSAGLFQIRWSTAASLKGLYPDLPKLSKPSDLFDLDTQRKYAVALAKDIKPRANSVADFVAIWNAGRVAKDGAGQYINQTYVNLVSRRAGIGVTELVNAKVA